MRIAVFLPNGAEWALLFWASVKLGSIFVSLDERAVPRKDEVHHFFDVTKPCAIFVSSGCKRAWLDGPHFPGSERDGHQGLHRTCIHWSCKLGEPCRLSDIGDCIKWNCPYA